MTIEEAITQLKMDRDLANFNPMTGEEEPMNEDCRKSAEALDMAIKAIEQESILDKVRAEIEHHRRKTQSIDPYDLVGDCLDIIDKYKTEMEGEE